MSVGLITVLAIAFMFLLFVMGTGIGIAMALAGFVGFWALVGWEPALNMVVVDFYGMFSGYTFTVVPLFTLMGQLALRTGIAGNLYDSTHKFVGHVPGGLAIGTVIAGGLFKAICGSMAAATATFATCALPEMNKYGYDKRLSCGVVASAGTLGGLIPPNLGLILYGLMTGVSIGKLFLAGILPGIMAALSFIACLFVWCKINPSLGPKGEKSTWRERIASLPAVGWVIVIFVVVMGGITFGFFTPTEAGSVGAMAVLLLSIIRKKITVEGFLQAVLESLYISCMVLILLAGASILGHFFTATRTPHMVADFLGGLSINHYIILVMILLVYLIGGEFIDDLAFFLLATPVFAPVIQSLGFDLIWFAILVSTTLMIGAIIPPLAMQVFIVSGIAKVPTSTIYKGVYPFVGGLAICIVILILFPQISLWLPNLFME